MKPSGLLWCGGGPTRHSAAMAGTAAMLAAAPSIVRRVIFRPPEAMLCCIVISSIGQRGSKRVANASSEHKETKHIAGVEVGLIERESRLQRPVLASSLAHGLSAPPPYA